MRGALTRHATRHVLRTSITAAQTPRRRPTRAELTAFSACQQACNCCFAEPPRWKRCRDGQRGRLQVPVLLGIAQSFCRRWVGPAILRIEHPSCGVRAGLCPALASSFSGQPASGGSDDPGLASNSDAQPAPRRNEDSVAVARGACQSSRNRVLHLLEGARQGSVCTLSMNHCALHHSAALLAPAHDM